MELQSVESGKISFWAEEKYYFLFVMKKNPRDTSYF